MHFSHCQQAFCVLLTSQVQSSKKGQQERSSQEHKCILFILWFEKGTDIESSAMLEKEAVCTCSAIFVMEKKTEIKTLQVCELCATLFI